jgi:hypothetical protein
LQLFGAKTRIIIAVFLSGGVFEVDPFSLLLFSPLHPIHHFLHALLALPFVFLHLELQVLVLFPELTPNNFFYFISILHPDIFQVLSERLKLIFLVDVHCIIDQFDQVGIEINAFVLLVFSFIVDILDHIVVFLVVGPLLCLMLDKLSSILSSHFPLFLLAGNNLCDFPEFSKMIKLLIALGLVDVVILITLREVFLWYFLGVEGLF